MTLLGLVLRFLAAYWISSILGVLASAYFANGSFFVITTAALLASAFYVGQLFCRRNGRKFSPREVGEAWFSFWVVDMILQAGALLLSGGALGDGADAVKTLMAHGFPFLMFLHGVLIYAFIRMAEKVAVRQLAAPKEVSEP